MVQSVGMPFRPATFQGALTMFTRMPVCTHTSQMELMPKRLSTTNKTSNVKSEKVSVTVQAQSPSTPWPPCLTSMMQRLVGSALLNIPRN